MTWSYSKNPSSSPLDQIRFLIGDTLDDDPLLQNEEIQSVLDTQKNIYLAAEECCEAIVASFSRLSDKKIGPMVINQETLSDKYTKLAMVLHKRAKKNSGFVGAQSDDVHKPMFTADMMNDE